MVLDVIARLGLQGVIAAETRLSDIDGEIGQLVIGGYALEEIAPHAIFEEMVYLLWHDRLPTQHELMQLQAQWRAWRTLPPLVETSLREAASQQLATMDALRMAVGLLSLQPDAEADDKAAGILVAAFPVIVAAYWRLLNGHEPIAAHDELPHAANFLYMLDGQVPSEARVRALDTYLNTVIDHGFNASTFTARVIASTHSDIVSAIVGAIGALKGPLHGGAPGPALDMVFEIGESDQAEAVLRQKLDAGERLMGFGHRVYKVRDPRADVLNTAAEEFFAEGDQRKLYDLARHVEATALDLLEEYKPGRRLQTNVEFYTALVLHGVGLDSALFTPTFAISRVGGWTAHALEHRHEGRLLRPLAAYSGKTGRVWQPISQR